MIIIVCKECYNAYLEKAKGRGMLAYCQVCKKDLDLYQTEFMILEEKDIENLPEFKSESIQKDFEKLQRKKNST